ncbi:19155_t:CDS:2, partial [Racocetra fulgida]
EWKQHNINMKEDLLEGIIENETNVEGADNNVDDCDDQNMTLQQRSDGLAHIKINDNLYEEDNRSMLQQTIFDNQQARQLTRDDSDRKQINDDDTKMFSEPISQQEIQGVQGQEINETINSYDFIPNKKRRHQALQDILNNPRYQHNIYRQIANKHLVDYRLKMENQMHAKYNIHERIYKVGDLVKIQIAKIDRGPGDPGEVLPLGPKEFPELNNPSTDTTISIIEAARLQSNSLA